MFTEFSNKKTQNVFFLFAQVICLGGIVKNVAKLDPKVLRIEELRHLLLNK